MRTVYLQHELLTTRRFVFCAGNAARWLTTDKRYMWQLLITVSDSTTVTSLCWMQRMRMLTATIVYAVAIVVMTMGQNIDGTNSASTEFKYVVTEEEEVGSVVADLVSDAGLRQTLDGAVLDALVFDVFHGRHSELFDVDSPSGIVRVKHVIDRDVVCYKQPTCVIPLDVAIVRPNMYFRVCAPMLLTYFFLVIKFNCNFRWSEDMFLSSAHTGNNSHS